MRAKAKKSTLVVDDVQNQPVLTQNGVEANYIFTRGKPAPLFDLNELETKSVTRSRIWLGSHSVEMTTAKIVRAKDTYVT